MRLTILVLCLGVLTACGSQGDVKRHGGTEVKMQYSTLLRMNETDEGTEVTIVNPWNTVQVLQHFVIKVAKKNAAVFIEPHCALLEELGCNGMFSDLSKQYVPNGEQIVEMNADAILVSPFENSGGFGGIEKLGIDIIECADYMEPTPLGRAEWMKMYGRLFGCGEKADSLFGEVERLYLSLKDSAETGGVRPKIACDLITGGTWYVPGGNSTIGHIIEDAGGDYLFADEQKNGSLALAPETVFDRCADADIWIIRYSQNKDMTYAQMEKDDARYSRMKAWKERNVFGCNLSNIDFFTETPFHPELLLKDIIGIIQGEETRYFKELEHNKAI